jgi:hypothetical protein
MEYYDGRPHLWMEIFLPDPLTEEEYCRRDDERGGEKIDEILAQQDELLALGYHSQGVWE